MQKNKLPKIKGISHITLICKDLEKTTYLLKEIFNAKEIYSSGEKTFSIAKEKFFDIAGIWVAIMQGDPVHKTYNHIAFRVEESELALFENKIKALGLEQLPGRERNKKNEGNSLYFYDYDNHLFELHSGDLQDRLRYYNAE